MAEKQKERSKLIKSLKSHFRLVVLNEDTLEEKASFKLRPLNVFVTVGLTIILLIVLTTILIAFTGLREYIPGYADVKMKRQMYNLMLKADSLQYALTTRERYLQNIKNIISGEVDKEPKEKRPVQNHPSKFDTIRSLKKSQEDSVLRKEIETKDIYSLGVAKNEASTGISSFLFFPPIKGTVTSRFNTISKHYGIDIVGKPNEAIKATLDGTVLLANFTSETGWTIGIQHSDNLFSLYKHNSALLKKVGDYVKAGEVIAIIGNSGELTTGSHLHFELWYNGSAIDPQKYISF
jgi:murein DD-endopeptidase MepM/ murein hydrolase activator NlpD